MATPTPTPRRPNPKKQFRHLGRARPRDSISLLRTRKKGLLKQSPSQALWTAFSLVLCAFSGFQMLGWKNTLDCFEYRVLFFHSHALIADGKQRLALRQTPSLFAFVKEEVFGNEGNGAFDSFRPKPNRRKPHNAASLLHLNRYLKSSMSMPSISDC